MRRLPGPRRTSAGSARDSRIGGPRTWLALLLFALLVSVALAAIQAATNALVRPALGPSNTTPGFSELLLNLAMPQAAIWLLLFLALIRFTPPALASVARIGPRWIAWWLPVVVVATLVLTVLLSAVALLSAAEPIPQRALFEDGSLRSAFLFECGRNLRQSMWLTLLAVAMVLVRAHTLESQRERMRSAELSMHLARARMDALSARLNPHFLFNALHTLSALVHADPDRAVGGIARLGEVLRGALGRSERQVVALGEEVDFTSEYLAIEALRFGERLECAWRIDPAAAQAAVPPFLLQPLVENAVKYGVDGHRGKTRIAIAAWIQGEHLWIEVAHRSEGAAPSGAARDGLGLGLRNLRERLDALYGAERWVIRQTLAAEASDTLLVLPVTSGRVEASGRATETDGGHIDNVPMDSVPTDSVPMDSVHMSGMRIDAAALDGLQAGSGPDAGRRADSGATAHRTPDDDVRPR